VTTKRPSARWRGWHPDALGAALPPEASETARRQLRARYLEIVGRKAMSMTDRELEAAIAEASKDLK